MGRPLRMSAPRKKPGTKNQQQAFKRDAAASQNADRAALLATPTTASSRPPVEAEQQPKQCQNHTTGHEEGETKCPCQKP